jgi:glyoxylase-like metal-dependent hydrolase (beta-lactamase superfamily II)
MTRNQWRTVAGGIAGVVLCLTGATLRPLAQDAPAPASVWSASLEDVRRAARVLPGARPLRVNMIKFAESRRTKNFSVKGAPATPSVQARTAFQVVYGDGTIMVDAGMDLAVHRFFGRGVEEPYFPDSAAQVEAAVQRARMIVVTHEHGDHVAGVIRGSGADALAAKTILTKSQIQTLLTAPQMPEIRLTPAQAGRFIVIDYERPYPIAPGMALVKSPGHTPGSQMVYVALASGRELLLIGDTTWHMDGVREIKEKDAPWIVEDTAALRAQLTWLNGLARTDPQLTVIASHDDEQHATLVQQGVLATRFE